MWPQWRSKVWFHFKDLPWERNCLELGHTLSIPSIMHTRSVLWRVTGICWSLSQLSLEKKSGYTLDRSSVHHRATCRQPCTLIELPINLTCMSLDCGRKPECPDNTHRSTGKTCKFHTERLPQWFKPRTFLLWGSHRAAHVSYSPLQTYWHDEANFLVFVVPKRHLSLRSKDECEPRVQNFELLLPDIYIYMCSTTQDIPPFEPNHFSSEQKYWNMWLTGVSHCPGFLLIFSNIKYLCMTSLNF